MELYLATGLGRLGPELGWLATLLTYSLHALLWAGVAALLVRLRSVSFSQRHVAWKLALLAPLVTTGFTLSAVSSLESVFGNAVHAPRIALLSLGEPLHWAKLASGATSANAAISSASMRSLLGFAKACLLLGAALGVARFAAVAYAQWRRLGPRRPVRDARLLARLTRLAEPLALGEVRLTESANVDCPLVLGTREICIPLPTLTALDDAEVDAVLAHELAHLERGDALWFPLFGVVQAALWFHPVTRWVGAHVRQSAELACDERCLELTSEPLALARALTRIAARALGAERAVVLPSMTRPQSSLVARVARLTSDAARAQAQGDWRSRTGLFVSLTVVALLCLGSSVRVADARPAPTSVSAPPAGPRGSTLPAQALPSLPGAQLNAQMAQLARDAQRLEAEIAALSTQSAREAAGESPSARLLELEQELRHARQMQTFLESSAANGR